MLTTSFAVLGVAVLLGLGLACVALLDKASVSHRAVPVAYVHGALGAVGVGALLLALRGPPRGVHSGAGGFGIVAGALMVATLLAGIVTLIGQLRHRPVSAAVIALHASLGIAGYVILAAYWSVPA